MLIHTGTRTIMTERLILRRFAFSDTESVWRSWVGDKAVQNDYGEPVYETLEDTGRLLEKYIASYEKPETYRWGIFPKEDPGSCAGQTAFFIVDSHNRFCEIEYCMGRAYQGSGYTTEAVKAAVEFGFNTVGFNRIQVSHRHVNIPSKRVIEKCGFVYEGTLRQYFNHLGEFHDRVYYSILKEEYKNENA